MTSSLMLNSLEEFLSHQNSASNLDEISLVERGFQSEISYQGHFLTVKKDQVVLPDASQAQREYIVHPGAVMIVPVIDECHVVIERQFRYPLHRVFLEFPAGKIDTGEKTKSTAVRELQEETGLLADEWALAGRINNAIAYSDEFIEIWFAKGLRSDERRLDVGEFIDLYTANVQTLDDLILSGDITDVKTIIGLYWWQQCLSGKKVVQWENSSVA